MKTIFSTFLLVSVCFTAMAQSVKIYEKEEKVDKMQRKGYAVLLLLEESFVDKAWSKKVKEFGKVDSKGSEYMVKEAVMPTFSPTPIRFYSKVTEKAKQGTEVWIGVDLGPDFVTKKHVKSKEAEDLLYQFAVETYRADINLQIEEAEKTLTKTTKEYERSVGSELKVRNKIQKNKEEKKKLQDQIVQNRVDSAQLVKDLEMNKLEQKQDSVEVAKMKKAVEAVKAKLNNIK
jgi:hypothetical protein